MANIIEYRAKDGQNVELTFETIKRFLVQGKPELVSNQEMVFFMGICKARGLNPFAKDCYLIKYSNDPAAIITSIDFFRSRAKAQQDCRGWQSGVIVDRKGEIVHTDGLVMDDDILLGGWFRARPEGWDQDFNLEVNLKGYLKKTKDGNVTKFWQKENQPTMIRKVAESQGLRELWPDEFGKMYVDEEVDRTEMRESFFGKTAPVDMKKEAEGDIYEVHDDKPQNTASEPQIDQDEKNDKDTADSDQEYIDRFWNLKTKGLLEFEKSERNMLPLMSTKIQTAFIEKFARTIGQDYPDWLKNPETKEPENNSNGNKEFWSRKDELTLELGLPTVNRIMRTPPFNANDIMDLEVSKRPDFLKVLEQALDEKNS